MEGTGNHSYYKRGEKKAQAQAIIVEEKSKKISTKGGRKGSKLVYRRREKYADRVIIKEAEARNNIYIQEKNGNQGARIRR